MGAAAEDLRNISNLLQAWGWELVKGPNGADSLRMGTDLRLTIAGDTATFTWADMFGGGTVTMHMTGWSYGTVRVMAQQLAILVPLAPRELS